MNAIAQDDKVEIIIITSEIKVNRKFSGKFKYDVINKTNHKLIIFGLKAIKQPEGAIQHYTQNISLKTSFIIEKDGKNKVNKKLRDRCAKNFSYNFGLSEEENEKILLDKSVILKPNERRSFKDTFCINNFDLDSGEYEFYLVYTCGDKSDNMISNELQNEFKRKHEAESFKGWIVSNKVKLIIK